MEKKLRACRVNILPRHGGYFDQPNLPSPVNKKLPKPTPLPSAVQKASNPIALRYWNQCLDSKSTEKIASESTQSRGETQGHQGLEVPPWASVDTYKTNSSHGKPKSLTPQLQVKVPDITKRVRSESVPRSVQYTRMSLEKEIVRHHDDPSPMVERKAATNQENEVFTVLSTAGAGINRENEVHEARGNINRFITVDKVKRSDALRVVNDARRKTSAPTPIIVDKGQYEQVKEEQIKVAMDRANFQNNAHYARIPKPPQPFKSKSPPDEKIPPIIQVKPKEQEPLVLDPVDQIAKLSQSLNQTQQLQLAMSLFKQLSLESRERMMLEQLSLLSKSEQSTVVANTSDEVVNTIVSLMFPRTSNDVKLSLVGAWMPDLSSQLENKLFRGAGKERPSASDVSKSSNNKKDSLCGSEGPLSDTTNARIPEIKIDSADEVDGELKKVKIVQADVRFDNSDVEASEEWGQWEDGDEFEFEVYEQDV